MQSWRVCSILCCKGGDWSKTIKHPLLMNSCWFIAIMTTRNIHSIVIVPTWFVLQSPRNLDSLALFYMLLVIWQITFHKLFWQFQSTGTVHFKFNEIFHHIQWIFYYFLQILEYRISRTKFQEIDSCLWGSLVNLKMSFISIIRYFKTIVEVVVASLHLPQIVLIISLTIHWNVITSLTLLNLPQN